MNAGTSGLSRENSPWRDIFPWQISRNVGRCLLVFLSVLPLLVAGCKKDESNLTQSLSSPTASAGSTPAAHATITASPDANRRARFVVLLYHRFEDRAAELVTTPNDFRAQMKALKDNRISVISMQDLMAWRKGEKAIPSKSIVITLDDEWNSQYYVAWPILKEFGYPFTLFVYTQWIGTGGKAMTWAQLEEMRDAGVDIEAHTVSHHDLRHAPRGQDYTSWLHSEVYGCKETLESKLGVKIIAFAFPYGFHNEVVRKTAKEAGYEMQFTVYGRHMDINVPGDQIGRYAIDSLKGDEFKAALVFGTIDSSQPGVETSQLASATMLTEPLNDQHITEPKPTIKANLASMGDVDPKSVEVRVGGFGLVPAVYDPNTKLVTYVFTQKLVPKMYIVILTAKLNGKKVETRWDFTVDAAGPVATN
jgi:peptidoglycan/xylan/chitin deacetylase (PgdA/CDA1 family)